jgi:Mn2+/Fe2+ NRAMP family transporter
MGEKVALSLPAAARRREPVTRTSGMTIVRDLTLAVFMIAYDRPDQLLLLTSFLLSLALLFCLVLCYIATWIDS